MSEKKVDVDGYCAWCPNKGFLTHSIDYSMEAAAENVLGERYDTLKPVKLIDAHQWAELMEWVEDFRTYIECVQRTESNDREERYLIDKLNKILPE